MLIFKNKNIIRFGLNLGVKNITRYQFLLKIAICENSISSIMNINLIIYKLLLFKSFLNLHENIRMDNTKILMVDGTFDKPERHFLKKYISNLKHFYINEDF